MDCQPMYKQEERRLETPWLGRFEKIHKTKDMNRFL
jgi:hypothetical protein